MDDRHHPRRFGTAMIGLPTSMFSCNELERKPLDRPLLDRFGADIAFRGKVCDMGCGPDLYLSYMQKIKH